MAKVSKGATRLSCDVVLALSGGLDSVVMLYDYAHEKERMRATCLDFGKPASQREIASAKYHTLQLGVPLDVVPVHGLSVMTLGLASIADQIADELDIKEYETDDGLLLRRARGDQTRVSGFYVVMSIIAYYAQLLGVERIAFAVTSEQTEDFPGVIQSFAAFGKGIRHLNPDAGQVQFETPLASLKKSEVIDKGSKLNVPVDCTWSCLLGGVAHCGKCRQCLSRKEAFKKSKTKDTTVYRDQRSDLDFLGA